MVSLGSGNLGIQPTNSARPDIVTRLLGPHRIRLRTFFASAEASANYLGCFVGTVGNYHLHADSLPAAHENRLEEDRLEKNDAESSDRVGLRGIALDQIANSYIPQFFTSIAGSPFSKSARRGAPRAFRENGGSHYCKLRLIAGLLQLIRSTLSPPLGNSPATVAD